MDISDKLRLFSKVASLVFAFGFRMLIQHIAAVRNRWTYREVPDPKNVVIIGGSFAGIQLAKRLSQTLPTGFRVVLVEKNSHINYSFNFPRYSVLQGHEHAAFIPYENIIAGSAPSGAFKQIRGTVSTVEDGRVNLDRFLPRCGPPSRSEACEELQTVQDQIKASSNIAIIGAGAVGVELATDIKDFYPDKNVTLIHSRDQILNCFGNRLHEYALAALRRLGVRVILGQRPHVPGGRMSRDQALTFSDGHEELFDLIIPCTGQVPNSSVLARSLPTSISQTSSRILVKDSLQIITAEKSATTARIFALGDVAEHGGPRMARTSFFQADVVQSNMLAMIEGSEPSSLYKPRRDIEGAIKLTLGKPHHVLYSMEEDGRDLLISADDGGVDLEVRKAWWQYGAKWDDSLLPA